MHLRYIGPQALIDSVPFSWHLLLARQDCFHLAQAQRHLLLVDALHRAVDEFVLALGVYVEQRISLSFPNSLQNDLTGCLGGNAAEVIRRRINGYHIADVRVCLVAVSLLQRHLAAVIGD